MLLYASKTEMHVSSSVERRGVQKLSRKEKLNFKQCGTEYQRRLIRKEKLDFNQAMRDRISAQTDQEREARLQAELGVLDVRVRWIVVMELLVNSRNVGC